MKAGLTGRRVAILATDGVEQSELAEPREALRKAGALAEIVSTKGGRIQGTKHGEPGDAFDVDHTLAEVHAGDFDALLLPGGEKSPDTLRRDEAAVQFVREFMVSDKPVGAICHGAWLLVAADAVAGRAITSAPEIRGDVTGAGGEWEDVAVKVDGRLVTGRTAKDVAQFSSAVVREFTTGITNGEVDRMSEQSFPASDPPPGPTAMGGRGASREPEQDARP